MDLYTIHIIYNQVSYCFSVQCRISWPVILNVVLWRRINVEACPLFFNLHDPVLWMWPTNEGKIKKLHGDIDVHWSSSNEKRTFFSMPSLHQSSKETTTVNMTWIDTRIASMLGCLEVYLSLEETMNTWPDLCYGGFCGRLASDGYNKGMMTHRGRNPQGPKIMYSNQGGWLKKNNMNM